MSSIAEFTIPTEALPGGVILTEMTDIRLEVERIIPTDDQAFPFVWVFGEGRETFIRKLEEMPEIADLTILDRLDHSTLVRTTWTLDADVLQAIKALKATILEATGSAEHWWFRIRAINRERIELFAKIFQEQNIPVNLERIYDLSEKHVGSQYELTPEQQELLVAAYEAGYFEKPRRVTQAELGEEFDITSRAVSDRLRRGMRNLVSGTLVNAPPPAARV